LNGKCEIAQDIFELNPKIKILVAVRNPIDRAFSHYRWMIQMGRKLPSFNEAIKNEPQLVSYGLYYRNMIPFWNLFPRENILIVLYDDIKRFPQNVQKEVYGFLGVDHNFDSGLCNRTVGKTINPRFRMLEYFRIRTHNQAVKHNMSFIITFFKKSGLSDLYRKINNKSGMQSLSHKDRRDAYRYFEDDLEKFSKESGKDISSWLID
jgi:hypothetical protein